jgi:hypothetical protein
VVPDYLVDNFGFEDGQLKRFGVGKKGGANPAALGTVEIIIYPPKTEVFTTTQTITSRQ